MSNCHCLLSLCLFNLYVGHIMRNAGLDELQARIKIGEGNNKLRYADDITLTAESKEELKSLLTRVFFVFKSVYCHPVNLYTRAHHATCQAG